MTIRCSRPWALPVARALRPHRATGAQHALHMPSHIFVQIGCLGRDGSVERGRLGRVEGVEYKRNENMSGSWEQDLHTAQWLQYGYLQEGR